MWRETERYIEREIVRFNQSEFTFFLTPFTQVHLEVLTRITQGVEALGFGCQGVIESPLKGDKSGNTEFLAHFVR